MRIFIDADGCPVVPLTCAIAELYQDEVIIVCDYAHQFDTEEHVRVVLCDQGKDRVDFTILRMLQPQDILITQDYGLAQLALIKQAYVLSQNGLRYDHHTINQLLSQRALHSQLRHMGVRSPHMKKRTKADDQSFYTALVALLEEVHHGQENKIETDVE